MSPISSSEICVLTLVNLLVLGGREYRSQTIHRKQTESNIPLPIFKSKETPLNIMCFLSDLLRFEMVDKINDARAFLVLLQAYTPKGECEESVAEMVRRALQFHSIAELEDTIEKIPILLNIPTNTQINPNRVTSPFIILPESLLGRILRSISLKWHDSLFEDIWCLYDKLQILVNTDNRVEDIGEKCNLFDISSRFYSFFHPPCSRSYLELFNKHSKLQDVVPAMDNLHKYYDLGGKCDGSPQFSFFPEYEMALGPNPHRRHQQAMLSMATVWVRGDNSALAACAVEEALKQAQQRGDHESVSQSLLLLQHILVQSSKWNTKVMIRKSIMSTLQQLVQNTEILNLRVLASQARLLLAQIKMQAYLKVMDDGIEVTDDHCLKVLDHLEITPQEIRHNILMFQSGESVTCRHSNSSDISNPLPCHYNFSSHGPTYDELGLAMPLSLCVSSADFWYRQGKNSVIHDLL